MPVKHCYQLNKVSFKCATATSEGVIMSCPDQLAGLTVMPDVKGF
jgi:hypothetical protein